MKRKPSSRSAAPADALAALADREALWNTIWRTSGEYVAIVDRDGTILDCNRVDDGFTLDQVIGRHFLDFTTPDCSALLQQTLDEAFATGADKVVESTVRRLNGELNYFVLRIGPVTVAGRTVALLVCCESILSLKQSQQTLEHERHVLKQLLEIQERERQVIAYEIHDGLAQYLAGAIMHLQAFQHSAGAGRSRDLVEGLRLLTAAAEESRRLIGGLRPPTLDELGIVASVEALVRDTRIEVPRVDFEHAMPAERLAPHLETAMFRIVQESLANVRRHARARHAAVRLTQATTPVGRRIRIRVQDDGIGFDPGRVPDDRFGLEGIRQRARMLGAEAVIRSRPGAGTVIEVDLPLIVAEETAPGDAAGADA
jgi:PAS domain S-box-containing protein